MRSTGRATSQSNYKYIQDDFGNAVLLRRCPRCERWLVAKRYSDFHESGKPKGQCIECRRVYLAEYRRLRREAVREHSRDWRDRQREDPIRREEYLKRRREEARRRRARNPEAAREANKRYMQKVFADPEKHAKFLESRRIADRLRRERKGEKSVPQRAPRHKYYQREKQEKLELAPLQKWIKERLPYFNDLNHMAEVCDVHERRLRAIRDGEYDSITLSAVDRMLSREGSTHLRDLYPEAA